MMEHIIARPACLPSRVIQTGLPAGVEGLPARVVNTGLPARVVKTGLPARVVKTRLPARVVERAFPAEALSFRRTI